MIGKDDKERERERKRRMVGKAAEKHGREEGEEDEDMG